MGGIGLEEIADGSPSTLNVKLDENCVVLHGTMNM